MCKAHTKALANCPACLVGRLALQTPELNPTTRFPSVNSELRGRKRSCSSIPKAFDSLKRISRQFGLYTIQWICRMSIVEWCRSSFSRVDCKTLTGVYDTSCQLGCILRCREGKGKRIAK